MKKLSAEIKVGFLFLIALILFGYFAIKVGTMRLPWQKQGYEIFVYFDNIAGLEDKAPVRLAGVRIGSVTGIFLENGKARVSAEIDPEVKIGRDAVVNVSQMGVMGERYLEIIQEYSGVPCEEGAGCLGEGDSLRGSPPTSFDQVISVVNSIGHDIKSMTASWRRVLASREGEERMASIIENIDSVTGDVAEMLSRNQDNMAGTIDNLRLITENLRVLLQDNSTPFSQTLENVQDISATIADKAPGLLEGMEQLIAQVNKLMPEEGTTLHNSIRNLEEATYALKDSLASMREIVAKVEHGEGTLGKLISDDTTHRNLNAALVELDGTLEEAKNVLGRVSQYETSIGYRSEYLAESDEYQHFISLKIQPRLDKYYLIEIIDSPRGNTFETTTHTFTTTNSSQNGYDETEVWQEETKVKDEFLVNLQIAKEFHNLTFRGGLIETQGGFGLDLNLFRKNLMFSVDSWNFGRETYNFHMKLSGRLQVYHGLYLIGGWDDLLNTDLDSYFIGAGFIFRDEDMKYLLGLAASASSSM